MPIKTNEIQPHDNNTIFLNANSIKTKYGAGYVKSDEHGVLTSSAATAGDIVLPHKNMIVGNTSGIGKASYVIKCEGEEVKSVGINTEPDLNYSLVVGSKSSRFQDIYCGTIRIRELGVDERITT